MLGLINAPLAERMLWGLQNIFSGLALFAPLALQFVRVRRSEGLSARGAIAATLVVAVALLAVSAALYLAAAAGLPAVVAAVFAPSAIPWLTLGTQLAASVMLLSIFVPDIIAVAKGRAPEGFTSMVSLLFFAAMASFIIWCSCSPRR